MLKEGETIGEEVPFDKNWDHGIQLEKWCRVLDKDGQPTGTIIRVEGLLLLDIYKSLQEKLVNEGLWNGLDYFSIDINKQHLQESRWPANFRWVACYAVTGGSEGHYIHISWIHQNCFSPNTEEFFILGKTFEGMEFAQKVAAFCAKMLGA